MKIRDAQFSAAGTSDKTYIEDVFSTYLYTGNGSTQTINNGIDLADKGGMVWVRGREANHNVLFDTNRGVGSQLISNTTAAQTSVANSLDQFNSTGFRLAADPTLLLNTTNAETTGSNLIDPYPQGFALLSGVAANNASGGTYIYLAIA